MKIFHGAIVASALLLGACQTTTGAQDATAVDPLLGKRLVSAEGTVFLFDADGTVGGTLRNQPIVGTYTASAREICSTYSSPDFLKGQEFCSVPVYTDDSVVFKRRDGTESQPYKIGG